MGNGLDVLLNEQAPVTEPPIIKRPAPKPLQQKRRSPLTSSEKQIIREAAARGASSSEIAAKLARRPETIRSALRRMRAAPPSSAPPTVEPLPANGSAQKPKAKSHTPFTQADRIRIENLVRSGLSAAQIAERVGRGLRQVSRVVKELDGAQPRAVALQVGDTKASLPTKTWDMLTAAAKRRSTEPAVLLAQICQGIIEHGSIDRAVHADAGDVANNGRGLRVLSIAIDLEAIGRCGDLDQLEYQIPIKARLRSLRADGDRAG
jgi:DNA-binding CsgD family transcriptional regulator